MDKLQLILLLNTVVLMELLTMPIPAIKHLGNGVVGSGQT